MAKKHVDDALLQRALGSYLNQIGGQFAADGAADCGVIVLLARPRGDGSFVTHCAGVINKRQMDGPLQRELLKAAHNASGVIIPPAPPIGAPDA